MGIRLNATSFIGVTVLITAIIYALEQFAVPGPGGSLLLTMTIWLAIAEGCVALMAGAEIAHAKWHKPILDRMLSAHPMILVIAVLFAAQVPQLSVYPWIEDDGMYLNKTFFIARHFAMPVIMFLFARRFASTALRGLDSRRFWAVIYCFLFIIHQSMIGIEWIMTLEKPWFSTLLGAFFMVSAWQSGICAAAILLFTMRKRFDDELRYVQKSIGGLMFGFAVFWAYFYFSQLIVIWYGNLPEEVGYLAKRIGYHTPYWAVARLIFGMCWVVPFTVLMGRKPKTMPGITTAVGFVILAGFVLEKWLMIVPVVKVNPIVGIVEMALCAFLFVSVMRSGAALLPGGAHVATAAKAQA